MKRSGLPWCSISLLLLFLHLLHGSLADNSFHIRDSDAASSSGALENEFPSMVHAALMAHRKLGYPVASVKAPVKRSKPELQELEADDHRRRSAPSGHSPGGGHSAGNRGGGAGH